MSSVTIEVASRAESDARFVRAAETGKPQGAFITFPTVEALFSTLTVNRWQIVRSMCGAGPMSIRELARRLERDVKRVHEDVQALLNVGVIDKTDDGLIEFPYDAVRVHFRLERAEPLIA